MQAALIGSGWRGRGSQDHLCGSGRALAGDMTASSCWVHDLVPAFDVVGCRSRGSQSRARETAGFWSLFTTMGNRVSACGSADSLAIGITVAAWGTADLSGF